MRVINGICSMGWEVNCLESLFSTVILVKLWMLWEAVKTRNQQWLSKTTCSQKEQKWLQTWASIWITLNSNDAKGLYIWQRLFLHMKDDLMESWDICKMCFTSVVLQNCTVRVFGSVGICTQHFYMVLGWTRFTVSVTAFVVLAWSHCQNLMKSFLEVALMRSHLWEMQVLLTTIASQD